MLPVERRAGEPGDELAALERLRHDEAVLDRKLDEARREAERLLAAARAEAKQLRAASARQLADDLARRAAALERAQAEVAASSRAEVAGRLEELRRRASDAREAALRLVVEAVAGGPA
jgi:F-type H+-transporting ATPase subunit b